LAFTVDLKSADQYLGDLVRSIRNNTDLTDISPGSDLATLLEGVASANAQISLSALKILQSTNLESLVGQALDNKASSIKLPNTIGGVGRKPASQSGEKVTIGSGFNKISSKLYAGKPAPFAGSLKLYVENASSFNPTGSIYIGRGTADRFEGPIPYISVSNDGSFWTVTLSSPLTKSHLNTELVIMAQGGDRTVPAGTTVQVPANSDSPSVQFTTLQSLTIPDGESEGQVAVTCTQFGEVGNALAGSITSFISQPFSNATVTNKTSFVNGKSTESDEDLRQRIKNYPATLSRGIATAIISAIIGATDQATGRAIESAIILEPTEPGDQARVFIDDGTGLEPTFGKQAYELLLQSASGQETRFRSAQYPITPAIAEGSNSAPFNIADGSSLSITVHVDEIVETYTITPSNYQNLNSATAYEVTRDLNSQSNIVGWRTTNSGKNIVMMDLSGKAEIVSINEGKLQATLGLPTAFLRPIFVYKDSKIQSFRGHTATLSTRPRNSWVSSTLSDMTNLRVVVDGVTQTVSITDSDFTEFQTTKITATVQQWATVFSRKIAGVKFTVSGQVIVWSTYQTFATTGSIEVLTTKADDSIASWVNDSSVWLPTTSGGVLKDTGAIKDFQFNRFTGELTFTTKPTAGSQIEIGSRTTRAHILSSKASTGLYALAPLASTGSSKLVVGFDGEFAIRTTNVAR
jgi:hypothetical protein